ncbi:hypothetical protein AWH62_15290 [Maricaulis sp. W15]|uniref:exonuclease domain-containing protein n=1 Tax=Maricaulis sp. W15 TaxID=1772333 RepID=UPI000948A713|nr:3'-5' exonuclease [Maricaulis sp. W15]OLF80593.1 hypothetical protein AWH62_15290 [Maricaulis sp. W15]
MFRITLAALLVLFTIVPATTAQGLYPPHAHPDEWGLAIVDVETTGLEPGTHEMIDIGAIYTDLDGRELGRFFVRIHPDHPERASALVRGMNGFDETRWTELGALSEADAVAAFLDFHDSTRGDRTMLFTAYNAYFDRNFLDALLRQHGSSFREHFTYFLLDIPSLAWGAGIPDMMNGDVAAELGLEAETSNPLDHTGLSGAEWNLAVLHAIQGRSHETGSTGQ